MANPSAPVCGIPSGKPESLETMDFETFSSMSAKGRRAWCLKHLGPLEKGLRSSAACHSTPPQLLATVLLNELADINFLDVLQQAVKIPRGSLGIAQIQVSTAVSDGLLDFPGDDQLIQQQAIQLRKSLRWTGAGGRSLDDYKKMVRFALVRERLTIPQFAVEAAAREIRILLDRMTKNLDKPWQQQFSFTLTSLSQLARPEEIYDYIKGDTQKDAEMNLAEMVVAAYNSPDIIIAKQKSSITWGDPKLIYRNGVIHGHNSRFIAGQLYDENLFH